MRRARQEEKAHARGKEHTFQPATNFGRSASLGRYHSVSEASGVSRHDLLYLDGERKRHRNLDARFDSSQRGTGELLGEYNKHWSGSARSKQFNPLLVSKQEENLARRQASFLFFYFLKSFLYLCAGIFLFFYLYLYTF